ncbi:MULTISPECIES: PadR family transcriptional regulator [unclassified Nocardioides]|uniref:PadR family transcriptional regulator n=1 Tax=unclassified Nocardioides TaxID=2615069 RepID=UPI0009EFA9FD|nr:MULTISPECIES: PadR family transcriptional regulator [unclassified Nocardioides]GAW50121.1 Transcriptional regulator, PadR-like family [Nocardioides sp. PD653-B2]GAW54806.1 Transcriptional regulator, PadR-like family [Nocardioides sp. PD653]
MSLKHALLGVLAARPMNGYALSRFFASSQNWVWSAPQSQIYSALKGLESEGLIEARREEGKNGLDSKVFSLTDAGRGLLLGWVATSHDSPPVRDAFALQALYFDSVPAEAARAVLEDFIETQIRLCDEWTTQRDALAVGDTPLLRERLAHRPRSEHARISRLKAHVFDGQVRQAQVRIDWAREAIALLDEPG